MNVSNQRFRSQMVRHKPVIKIYYLVPPEEQSRRFQFLTIDMSKKMILGIDIQKELEIQYNAKEDTIF